MAYKIRENHPKQFYSKMHFLLLFMILYQTCDGFLFKRGSVFNAFEHAQAENLLNDFLLKYKMFEVELKNNFTDPQ